MLGNTAFSKPMVVYLTTLWNIYFNEIRMKIQHFHAGKYLHDEGYIVSACIVVRLQSPNTIVTAADITTYLKHKCICNRYLRSLKLWDEESV